MSIKTVLVLLTGDDGDHAALGTAFSVAKSVGAHVDVVLAQGNPDEVVYAADLYQSADERRVLAAQRRAAAQLAFVLAAKNADIPVNGTACAQGATASYRVENGPLASRAPALSFFADLVVLPPLGSGRQTPLFEAFVEVLTTVRCPVLLAVSRTAGDAGKQIAVGWDGSLPAARALVAALPLLERQGSVPLLMVQADAGKDCETSEVVEYLALHGVKAEPRIVAAGHGGTGARLLAASKELDCGMIVLGAYGHNRTLETVFGGVTDDIVSSASLPVLLAH